MICNKCGAKISATGKFCPKCGAAVEMTNENHTVKEKQASKKPVFLIALIVLAVVAMGIAIASLLMKKDDGELTENTDNSKDLSASASSDGSDVLENTNEPDYLNQLVKYEAAQYNYSGLNILDLSVRNIAPGQKQEGMDWDSTLFYTLEDVYADSTEDNQIAQYRMEVYNFTNAQTGNVIQCFVYAHADSGQINKIVTVEQQKDNYLVSDYYYDDGKVNFVFTREVDVYTPTYATIDKVGNRYYFQDDVMVRYRTIEVPKRIVQQTLNPENTWYENTSYFELSSEEKANYDALEYQVLNEAYNVYNAVQNQENIYDMKGYVYSAEEIPLANVSIAVIDANNHSVLYAGESAEDGSYHIYVSLDNTDCYLQVYLESYLPVYIYHVKLDSSILGNSASRIYLSEIGAVQTDTKLYLYDSLELTENENAASLKNATVVIRSGLNAKDGEGVVVGNTGETGVFETSLTPGAYTAEYYLDGFATTFENFYVTADACIVKGYTVSAITDDTEKIVLCWDSDIDLDLLLYTPEKSAYGDMNYISIRRPLDDYGNYLTADATDSRCEILNISNKLDGQYKVYVNDYTSYQNGIYDSNALAVSGARIYVYTSEGLIAVYRIDPDKSGIVWNVCEKGTSYYPCSIVSSNLDEYILIDKTLITSDEVLEIYREFLMGNLTADYQGEQITYSLLLDEYMDDDMEPEYIEQRFALTDYDRDGIPELQVSFGGGMSDISVFTIVSKNNGLKVSNVENFSYMGMTMYKDGSIKEHWGLSESGTGEYIKDGMGNPLAAFTYYYSHFWLDELASAVQDEYERRYDEGYTHVYVTSGENDDYDAIDAFNDYVNQFLLEYCGGEVEFHDIIHQTN